VETLLPAAARIGALLRQRGETVAVAESAAGGLVSAALLAIPGASAFCRGGGVIYTREARAGLLGLDAAAMAGMRPATEAYALLKARRIRERLGADWGVAESGAAGPSGNRYGDPPGHAALAVSGAVEATLTCRTGSTDRVANMRAFAAALLDLFGRSLAPG
jgi:PncC family amidohydrolase